MNDDKMCTHTLSVEVGKRTKVGKKIQCIIRKVSSTCAWCQCFFAWPQSVNWIWTTLQFILYLSSRAPTPELGGGGDSSRKVRRALVHASQNSFFQLEAFFATYYHYSINVKLISNQIYSTPFNPLACFASHLLSAWLYHRCSSVISINWNWKTVTEITVQCAVFETDWSLISINQSINLFVTTKYISTTITTT